MRIDTSIAISEDEDLHFVTFYDQKKNYGFSLTRIPTEQQIEVMLADQSCYRPELFSLAVSDENVIVTFPPGTIDSLDGDDHIEITYDLSGLKLEDVVNTLRKIFRDISGATLEVRI